MNFNMQKKTTMNVTLSLQWTTLTMPFATYSRNTHVIILVSKDKVTYNNHIFLCPNL